MNIHMRKHRIAFALASAGYTVAPVMVAGVRLALVIKKAPRRRVSL